MDHLFARVLVLLSGGILLVLAFLVFRHRDDAYSWVEGFRTRHPALRAINPFARLNNPTLSRWNMVWVAFVATLMGALLMAGAFVGQFGQ